MFVCFRKVPCEGIRPAAAQIGAAVRTPVFKRRQWSGRWRIGREERLQPYTIKVYIVENHRVDGKVKQETIGYLGSIDATWLDSFWTAPDPSKLGSLRVEDWQRRSIGARMNFWNGAGKTLQRLENRIGPEMKRIQKAIDVEVPWPFQADRDRLELLEAQHTVKFWQDDYKFHSRQAKGADDLVEQWKEMGAKNRQYAMQAIKSADKMTDKVKELKAKQS